MLLPRKFSFPPEVTAVHSSRRNWAEEAKRRREKSQGQRGTNSLQPLCSRGKADESRASVGI